MEVWFIEILWSCEFDSFFCSASFSHPSFHFLVIFKAFVENSVQISPKKKKGVPHCLRRSLPGRFAQKRRSLVFCEPIIFCKKTRQLFCFPFQLIGGSKSSQSVYSPAAAFLDRRPTALSSPRFHSLKARIDESDMRL